MPTTLRVENLWKCYSAGVRDCSVRVWALRGCSLRIQSGDRIAIAGRPGAGKSTLLHCLAGLRSPDAGHIHSDFARVVYSSMLPAPLPRGSASGASLYLIDDLAFSGVDVERGLASVVDRRAAVIIATRHVASVAPFVDQVLTLRDGRLVPLPLAPIRRVAESAEGGSPAHLPRVRLG